jgi:hypothetical protein
MKHWFRRQSQPRRFFVLWAFFAVLSTCVQTAVSFMVAVYTGHVFLGPPSWVFSQAIVGTAILAAFLSWAIRGGEPIE